MTQDEHGPAGEETPAPSSCPFTDGEVVALLSDGLPYVVRRLPSLVDEKMVSTYVLERSRPDEGVSVADPAAHLVAVVQGEWVGFRSAAAGGRLLQVRKRGTRRLCLFSTRFGTWEHFSVDLFDGSRADGRRDDAGGWTTMPLVLRSRRLEKFTLSVDAMRVPEELRPRATPPGLADGGGNGQYHRLARRGTARKSRVDFTVDPVTRIVTPHTHRSQEDHDAEHEDHEGHGQLRDEQLPGMQGGVMGAMSELLVSEWSSFVLKEVRQRQALEREMHGLHEELGAAHASALAEVARAREEGLERARLAVDEVGGILKAVVDERERAMELLRHYCSRRARRRTLGKALRRWCARARGARRAKAACFAAWKARKRQMQLLGMALQRRWTRAEAEALRAWRRVCGDRRRRASVLRRAARGRERRAARRIMVGWLQYCGDLKKLEHSMLGLAMLRQSHAIMLSQCVRHWRRLVRARRAGDRRVARALSARALRALRAAARAWAGLARAHAQGRAAMRRMVARSEGALARAALRAWFVLCSVRGEAALGTGAAVAEAVARAGAELGRLRAMQVALDAFRSNARAAAHRGKLYRLVRRSADGALARGAFREWRGYCEHLLSCRDDAANVVIKREAILSLRALLRWRQAAREGRMRSASLELVAARLRRARGVDRRAAWDGWAGLVAEARARRRMALVIACASDRARRLILLSTNWATWRRFTSSRRRHGRIVSRCRATYLRNLLAHSLDEWRAEVCRVAERLECVRSCIKSKRLLMQWWMAWYWDSYEPDIRQALSSLYGNCEDTMDGIFQSKQSPAGVAGRSAFREWQRARADVRASQDMKTINHSGMTSNVIEGLDRFYDGDVTSRPPGGEGDRRASDVDSFRRAILEHIGD